MLNTLIVVGGTLLSRVLGLVREGIFADLFGASAELGAFRASFTILDMLYLVIIGGALGSSFIPVFGGLLEKQDHQRAWRLANTVLTLAFGVFVVIAALVGIFAEQLLSVTVAVGYVDQPEQFDLAVRLTRLMLVQPLLLGVAGLMMAILQTFERFTLPAIGYNVYNLAIIAFAWFLGPTYRVDALAWGVVTGAILFLLVQVLGVARLGLRFRPSWDWRMPEVRRVGSLVAPRLVGQSAAQINVIVLYALLSLISSSAQAANGYAVQVLLLPQGIIANSIGTVMFPRLTRLFADGQISNVQRVATQTLRTVLWLLVPISALFVVLHVPIVRVLFQRGEFDQNALALSSRALLFYSFTVIGFGGNEIITRTFYAMQDTRTPVVVSLVAITANAVLAWVLIQYRRDIGLVALVFSVSQVTQCAVLGVLLQRRFRRTSGATIRFGATRQFAIAVGASTAALLVVVLVAVWLSRGVVAGVTLGSAYQARRDFLPLATWLAGVGVAGLAAYVATSAALRLPEVHEFWRLIRRQRAA